jgi:cell fate regulator YaaT (PSP1 superfamily)
LKCCLAYEYEAYRHAKKGLPKIGRKVCWKDGEPCGKVIGHNIFDGTIQVVLNDGTQRAVIPDEIHPQLHRLDKN